MKLHSTDLSLNWIWRQSQDSDDVAALSLLSAELQAHHDGWLPAASMPSEIHVELLKANKIPHPYVGFNEHKVQWVGEAEWLYACTFQFDINNHLEHADLIFEGLDTFCTVYLNGQIVLEADNQFRTYSLVLDAKKLDISNKLLLHFKSAKQVAKALEKKYGRMRAGSVNLGDPSRVYVRKAQYDWRWDWGPELLSVGPYRPIRLLSYTTRILDLHVAPTVSSSLVASLNIDISLRGNITTAETAQVILKNEAGHVVRLEEVKLEFGLGETERQLVKWTFDNDEVKLWWPIGYGSQTLYTVEVNLLGEASFILDQASKRIGFRRVRLVQDELAEPDIYGTGTTFYFEVNNVPIFIGGSNWVPADNMLTTVTPDRYRAWLELVKAGNQNMVRLWGGGVYEPDLFYDLCDEMGLLVWQDFQFACGVYPAHDEFVESVRAEAEDNVTRLRHHPSMVLFCGNNEDYQQVLQWGDVPDLPAKKIYETVLPEIVDKLTGGDIPYHRGSPYGGKGWDTADPTIGDVHQWEIWAGEKPWQNYDIMGGRFVSEFGIPAMPDMRTIEYWLDGDDKERYAQSKLMAQHNKAGSHERRFAVLINEMFRLTGDFATHVYHTQILQSEALGWAYRSWRRQWKGVGKRYSGGAIVWQINDSWPVTSWAIADYFLRPKPAFYAIARELRPYTIGIARMVQKQRETDRPRQFYEFGAFRSVGATIEIWGTNSTLQAKSVKLVVDYFDIESDWTDHYEQEVILEANQSSEFLNVPFPEPPQPQSNDIFGHDIPVTRTHTVVVSARLLDVHTGEVIARHCDWPQPYKYIDFPDPELTFTRLNRNDESGGEDRFLLRVSKPVKGVVLTIEGEEPYRFSDNALDLVPGDDQEVLIESLQGREILATYMGKKNN